MIRLHYVVSGEDVYENFELDTSFDSVMQQVQYLHSRGIRMIGLETPEVKMFFDSTVSGMKSLSGKFKSGRA